MADHIDTSRTSIVASQAIRKDADKRTYWRREEIKGEVVFTYIERMWLRCPLQLNVPLNDHTVQQWPTAEGNEPLPSSTKVAGSTVKLMNNLLVSPSVKLSISATRMRLT